MLDIHQTLMLATTMPSIAGKLRDRQNWLGGNIVNRTDLPPVVQAAIAHAQFETIHPLTLAKRNRAWEARELFDLVNEVERELATRSDDEGPTRTVPTSRKHRAR